MIRRLLIFLAVLTIVRVHAWSIEPGQVWRYTLVEGSTIRDRCAPCDRESTDPLRGTFDLKLLEQTPLFSRYQLTNISWTGGLPGARKYQVRGSGEWRIGGEVVVLQQVRLDLEIDDGSGFQSCPFTNTIMEVSRQWPMLQASLGQENGTPFQTFAIELSAAPMREIWFSTTTGFTAAHTTQGDVATMAPGDLLANTARAVKRNAQLTGALGVAAGTGDKGLDALDILPGGEVLFSLSADAVSVRLGTMHHGDILSTKRGIYATKGKLLQAFDPVDGTDAGLDALVWRAEGEVWFSVRSNVFSRALSAEISRGDLLSSKGVVIRKNRELLSRFHPLEAGGDYGLDAVQVWSSGEIWFSTEEDFQDQQLGSVTAGDLLSDAGVIVFRNADLVSAFRPVDAIGQLGLDSLFVVSDALADGVRPRVSLTQTGSSQGRLSWISGGRVFQPQSSNDPAGPYLPLSAIMIENIYDLTLPKPGPSFYRVQQW
jgi:hypothetical protein